MSSFLLHKTAPRYPKAARELCRAAFGELPEYSGSIHHLRN
jgi:hypothetical protein